MSTQRMRGERPALAAVVFCGALSLACVTPEATAGTKTAVGGLGGAVAGGLLGKSIGGHSRDVIAGAIVGGLVGGAIGNVLDQRDRDLAHRTAHRALEYEPTGRPSSWQNPDNGHQGSFTPTRTYQVSSGEYCREYQQEISVGGRRERSYGTACRQPDGSWRVVN